ncbi:MAG TPA: adenosylcobinamide-GDP ribazoletransferase [Alphaproteobacteria bacterium]|nr:adenosylcobinamide-GDP ribazoletransferase [Alphaproteobacteria bacterium]
MPGGSEMGHFDWRHFDWSSLARGWGDDLRIAAILFTRLPIRREGEIADREAADALRAAPLIGLAIGCAGGIGYGLASFFGLSPYLSALLALALTIAATGAFHEDGLADFADALGGASPADRLAIMRDSRLGSYGALALLFSVGARAGALAQLAEPAPAAAALIAAAAASRGLLPLLTFFLEPARRDGLGAMVARPHQETVAAAAALGVLAAVLLLGPLAALAALALALASAGGIGVLARSRLGGYTGDVLGAAQQAAEAAVLLAAAICA